MGQKTTTLVHIAATKDEKRTQQPTGHTEKIEFV